MNEFKRVVLTRRYLITVILLYIMNAVIFQCSQSDTLGLFKDDISFSMFAEELRDRQEEEHKEFYDRLDKIPKEKERMLGISIFADEDSFAYKDIMKTDSDYAGLSGVVLSDVNDYAVDMVLGYRYMYVIGFIIIIMTVLSFMEDRKRGLDEVIYSCRNGRLVLAARRILILLFVSFITMTVLVSGVLAVSFIDYGGADILTGAVQSVGRLQEFVLPVSLMWFIVYYVVYLSMAYAVCGLVVWAVLSFVRNRNLGLIICVLIFGAEYFLYSFIPKGLTVSIFRYTNLWFLLEPLETYTKYTNFPFFDTIINLREYMECSIVVMLIIMCAVILMAGAKVRPVHAQGIVGRYAERAVDSIRRMLCLLNGFGFEVYKQLIFRRGILLIAVFGLVLVAWIDDVELVLSPGRELLDEFYDEYTGEMNEESLSVYEDIHEQVGDIDLNRMEPGNTLEYMFSLLMKQKEHADGLRARGISGWFINDRGYERLLGRDGDMRRMTESILAVAVTVLLAAFTYVTEYADGVSTLIRSSKRGRKEIFRRKMVYTLSATVIIWGIGLAANLYEVMLKYKLDGWNAPVQNITVLGDVGYDVSIGGFISLWYISGLCGLIACSGIAMLISVYGRRTGRVCVAALLLAPAGVLWQYMIPYLVAAPVYIMALIPIMVCITISAVCLYRTYRKWTY